MYTSFEVTGLRCFSGLTLKPLARVNLVAGTNGVGKTTLLEALFLHCGAYNPSLAFNLRAFRGHDPEMKIGVGARDETPWDSLFTYQMRSNRIVLKGTETAGTRTLVLSRVTAPAELARVPGLEKLVEEAVSVGSTQLPKVLRLEHRNGRKTIEVFLVIDTGGIKMIPLALTAPFPAFMRRSSGAGGMPEIVERFGRLERAGQQDRLLEVLKIIEPKLRRLATVVVFGKPILHTDTGAGALVPLPDAGEGLLRLADMMLSLEEAPHGVYLVDEIENGFHHSILDGVWGAIRESAERNDVQVFATTHSRECIAAAYRALGPSGDNGFRLHRLELPEPDKARAVTYDAETLGAAIESGLEVR